jgi:hypothetical protein
MTLSDDDDYRIFELRRAYQLSPVMARILFALLRGRVTVETIEKDLGIAMDPRVAVYRLRRRMSPYKIKIESMRDGGYWIEPADRDRISKEVSLASLTPAA